METMVTPEYFPIVKELIDWVDQFSKIKPERLRTLLQDSKQYEPEDIFMGYHVDIISSLVLSQVAKVGDSCIDFDRMKSTYFCVHREQTPNP